jgi:hypothetical protein
MKILLFIFTVLFASECYGAAAIFKSLKNKVIPSKTSDQSYQNFPAIPQSGQSGYTTQGQYIQSPVPQPIVQQPSQQFEFPQRQVYSQQACQACLCSGQSCQCSGCQALA